MNVNQIDNDKHDKIIQALTSIRILDLNNEVACLRRALIDDIEKNILLDNMELELLIALRNKEQELRRELNKFPEAV